MKNLIIKRTLIALFATLVFSGGFALTQSFYERQVTNRPGVVATTDPVAAITQPLATAANSFPTLQPLTVPTSVAPVQQPQSATPQSPAPTTGLGTTSVPGPVAQPVVVTNYYPVHNYDTDIADLRAQIRQLATQSGVGQLQYNSATRVLSLGSSSVRLPEYRFTSSSNSGSSSSGGSATVDLTPVTNRLDTIEATLASMPAAIPASTSATYYRGDQTWATLDTAAVPENGNLYFTPARFTTELATKTSDNLTEGSTNLYYTSARANSDFASQFALRTTDDLPAGSTNKYYSSALFGTDFATKTSDNLAEGTSNLYYTNARFDTRFGTKSTDNLTEGSTNQYFTNTRFDNRLATKTSDNVTEGTTNQYFTTSRAQNAITGAASSIVSNNLTASRALVSDASGKVAASAVTSTELGYLSGVTSAIQTQINNRMLTPAGATTQYIRGDGTLATLNTSIVPESGNLYFTNARARSAISVNSPLSYNSGTGLISIAQATSGSNGFLSFTDWNTFNSKVASATNGLNFDGTFARLGGTLDADTLIDTNNYQFGIGSNFTLRSNGFTNYAIGDYIEVDSTRGVNFAFGQNLTLLDSDSYVFGKGTSSNSDINTTIIGSSHRSTSNESSFFTGYSITGTKNNESFLTGVKSTFSDNSRLFFNAFGLADVNLSQNLFGSISGGVVTGSLNSMIWGNNPDIATTDGIISLGNGNVLNTITESIVIGNANTAISGFGSGIFGYSNTNQSVDAGYVFGNGNTMGKDVIQSTIVGLGNTIDNSVKSSYILGQYNNSINNAAYMIGEGMTSDANSTIYLGFDDATKTTIDSAGTMNVRGQQFVTTTNGSGSDVAVFDNGSGAICTVAPGGTEFACSSDERLKTNIETIPNALRSIEGLRGVTYNWKNTPENTTRQYGFIAQEVERVVPELVGTDYRGMKIMGYQNIVPLLVNAVNEIAQITGDFRDSLIAWMGNASNGIQQFFADTVTARRVETTELCVGQPGDQICVTKDQLEQLLLQNAMQPVTAPTTPAPVATTNDSPVNNSDADTAVIPAPIPEPTPAAQPEVTESQPVPTTE